MNSNKQKETAWQKWVYAWNPYHPDKLKKSPVQPAVVQESHTRKRLMQGMMVFLIIFLGWSAVAPIDAGVHLPGTVKVSGNRKEIKHPSGGVITEILVEEGARVREGDILGFWACGVTPQMAIQQANVDIAITHEPGYMLVTDLPADANELSVA